ncbi:DnaD and phage-associated domain-containing protein [Alkalithermobacter thermoalcaliphilus JW-YL-7 = DSM 7308]|uniref:DnaD and phage-associated domain-containing protein n=1 Tax=Alkalithermobacter thermoalcaliphilus JW-YL-7 = DSM 7308 TaxID=1121328 RepID=A0A150FUL9_CLOPD|nr:primosome, DnaD subunit [[Clostridium] paradoxum JW-YL-7 = DSM 7308]SHL09732.1 DnaD and phage-associated domain-containing protein [[Clostridium] paradoxum JW-YL-7 = DSM 7308]
MFFREINEIDLGETPVDNIFIDIFMPMTNGTYVKVYLLGYRYALDPSNCNVTNQTLAKNLNIPLVDVLAAWDFWEKKGIIKKHINSESDEWDYSIEFLNLKNLYVNNILKDNSSEKNSTTNLLSINENPNINKMFNRINEIIARPLVPNEKIQILDMMEKYNMCPDMITTAYSYAKDKKGVKSVKFVEGIIRNWYDSKIYTINDLEEYFAKHSERFALYKSVFRELGFSREPSAEEKKVINSWVDDLEFTNDVIFKACSKSKNTSNPSIAFIDGILRSWHKKGFKSLEDIENEVKPTLNKTNPQFKTKFHNFEQRTRNYTPEELERMILENQKNKFR